MIQNQLSKNFMTETPLRYQAQNMKLEGKNEKREYLNHCYKEN